MTEWNTFDIHGYAGMRVAEEAPTAALIQEMFAPFSVPQLPNIDVTLSGDFLPRNGELYAGDLYRYSEDSVYLNESDVQIIKQNGHFRVNGRRELLVSVLPLLDRVLVTRGVAMLHVAAVEYQGRGICLPAWGETGKTSTIAKLLRVNGVGFMADDWAFLTREGVLLGYQKPMFIKPHHRAIYPHLFTSKRKPLIPSRLTRQFARLSTAVHPIITRYPRIASVSRNWTPEHMKVTPRQAFPDARFVDRAPLALTVFMERFDGDDVVVVERSRDWLVGRLIGNFHAELSRHSQQVITALAATGLVSLEDTYREKAEVLISGLANRPVYSVQVPRTALPDGASDTFVENVIEIFDRAGIQ